jgi:hypothetical protein
MEATPPVSSVSIVDDDVSATTTSTMQSTSLVSPLVVTDAITRLELDVAARILRHYLASDDYSRADKDYFLDRVLRPRIFQRDIPDDKDLVVERIVFVVHGCVTCYNFALPHVIDDEDLNKRATLYLPFKIRYASHENRVELERKLVGENKCKMKKYLRRAGIKNHDDYVYDDDMDIDLQAMLYTGDKDKDILGRVYVDKDEWKRMKTVLLIPLKKVGNESIKP